MFLANIAVARSYLSAATKFVERTHAVSMVSLAQVMWFNISSYVLIEFYIQLVLKCDRC